MARQSEQRQHLNCLTMRAERDQGEQHHTTWQKAAVCTKMREHAGELFTSMLVADGRRRTTVI